MMRLLIVASDPMEYRGMLAFLEIPKRPALAVDWARSGRLGGHECLLVANGAGWKRAAAAVDAARDSFVPEAIVSAGFCGALDPALRIADVVVGNCVAGPFRRHRAWPVSGGAPYRNGLVMSIDHVAGSRAEKQTLHGRGGSAVEMEAAGVAERADALQLPFYCVRAVTDLACEDMANDFNSALRPDGHFATMLIFRQALRHPGGRIPELIRLRRRCVRAAQSLGEFFADCRF